MAPTTTTATSPAAIGPAPTKRTALRLIVCGGRRYADQAYAFAALDHLHRARGVAMVIEGGAEGADAIARHWANVRGVPCETVRADWAGHGKAAGPLRNRHMLGLGPDGVVAFPGGRGTADMTRQAEAAGVPVWRPGAGRPGPAHPSSDAGVTPSAAARSDSVASVG